MEAVLSAAVARFVDGHPNSAKLHEKALKSLPGGNTRTILYSAPFPIYMQRGEGYKLYDEDGYEYCDFVGELGAGLYGHSQPRLKEALTFAIQNCGLHLGATTLYEERFASLLCQRFGLERIRFANSGTEANLHCIAAARRFTGRRKVIAFRGGYHGSVLSFGTGVASNNVDPGDWIVLQYNDIDALRQAFEKHDDIAAVILEGMQSSGGAISASLNFIREIRDLSMKANVVFILDEVVTSRLATGGLQSLLCVKPDMTTLGKYLGGGMPFGAFGGRQDIMSVYDPRVANALAHSGTFQNNTMMLNAGFTGLSEIYAPEVVESFNKNGDDLRQRLATLFQGTRLCVTGRGTLMCVQATQTGLPSEQITCKDDISAIEDTDLKKLFWLEMLEAGYWVQQRGSIALNLQMPGEVIDSFVEAVATFCDSHRALIALPK